MNMTRKMRRHVPENHQLQKTTKMHRKKMKLKHEPNGLEERHETSYTNSVTKTSLNERRRTGIRLMITNGRKAKQLQAVHAEAK